MTKLIWNNRLSIIIVHRQAHKVGDIFSFLIFHNNNYVDITKEIANKLTLPIKSDNRLYINGRYTAKGIIIDYLNFIKKINGFKGSIPKEFTVI